MGTFAECILKLFPIVLNGFTGYQSGYNNIVVDTVNYMNDQADLMRQLIHYVEENPIKKPLVLASRLSTRGSSLFRTRRKLLSKRSKTWV